MNSDHQGARKSAGRISTIALNAILVVIAMALPLSAGGPGSWTSTGSLNTARANHAAAMLPNGQALIVGGVGESASRSRAPKFTTLATTRLPP